MAEDARVLLARNVTSGALSAEAPNLAAAVLDSASGPLCRKLKENGVPFVMYTGREHVDGDCAGAPVVRKPASAEDVVEAIRRLL